MGVWRNEYNESRIRTPIVDQFMRRGMYAIGVTVLFYVKAAPKQARELSMELTGAISLRRVSVL